jgi:hypothetical protein
LEVAEGGLEMTALKLMAVPVLNIQAAVADEKLQCLTSLDHAFAM